MESRILKQVTGLRASSGISAFGSAPKSGQSVQIEIWHLIDECTFVIIYSLPICFGETSVIGPPLAYLNVSWWVWPRSSAERLSVFSTPAGAPAASATNAYLFSPFFSFCLACLLSFFLWEHVWEELLEWKPRPWGVNKK